MIEVHLSKIHGESIWIDETHLITRESIRDVIGLCFSRPVPRQNTINDQEIIEITGATLKGKELVLRIIDDLIIRYVAMIIGHKIFLPRNDNIVSTAATYIALDMVRNGTNYDLFQLL